MRKHKTQTCKVLTFKLERAKPQPNAALEAAWNAPSFRITKLWQTTPDDVNQSMWIDPVWGEKCHGFRMIPKTKTGRMNILVGMDARTNSGVTRTRNSMIQFLTNLAFQQGFKNPEVVAEKYFKRYVNEGLIVPV